MDSLLLDLRYALRLLTRSPTYTFLALATLALGIGASTAIFTVLYHVVLRPLPFGASHELVFVNETSPDGTQTYSVSIPNFHDWRERNRTFQSLSAFRAASFNLTGPDGPLRVRGAMVSGDFFETLDRAPLIGNVFSSDVEASVVLSHPYWQNRFGGRSDVLGEILTLNGESFTVRGVMPEDFEFLTSTIEMWVPIGMFRRELPWDDRGSHPALWVVGRLAPDATVADARQDMDRIAREIDAEFDHADRIAVTTLHERSVRRAKGSLVSLMGAVGLMLLIACVNVANLVLAKAAGRGREMATRTALGADRKRLVGQLLTENLLLAGFGGLLGLLLGSWGVEMLRAMLPDNTPRLSTLEMDGSAFVFALIVSIVTGVAFGLTPLLHRDASLRTRMGTRARARGALVVAEVALAGILLVGAGLLLKSFFHLATVETGFESESRIAARIDLDPSRYGTAERSIPFYRRLVDDVRALPGVRSAAVSTGLPLVDPGTESGILREGVEPVQENFVLACFQLVSVDYFETLGIRLIAGRVFDARDRAGSPRVVVVDETLAETMFPGESALGKRIAMDGSPEEPVLATVVGIVGHVRNYQLTSEQYVEVYVPLEQPPSWLSRGLPPASLVVRTAMVPELMFGSIRDAVASIDPAQPIYGATTLDDVVETALAPQRTNGILTTSFALAALALAGIGLYGVLSSLVAQRTSEIGLRMALGATPRRIGAALAREALTLVGAGVALALAGSFLVARLLSSVLYGVGAFDPWVSAGALAVLAIVAAVACAVPARRASRLPAVEALRYD